ncbi:MAG: ImmA/IrrE family metallo-endopeptidase [Myxococcales bacterium]|nr:ImmA/IrrE family metallo-endopeptidase [Myxococcales bacterium]
MEPSKATGTAIASLRQLRGLSLSECANLSELSVEQVSAVESGGGRVEWVAALARQYGLAAEDFDGALVKLNGDPLTTVFLFQSEAQSFDIEDLVPLERAMRAARLFAAFSPDVQAAGLRRRAFTAVAESGPLSADAARQGHALARKVRASLGLPEAPLGDLRLILEERFGIPVLVDSLQSPSLRAAAALDANRACAAVLLAANDISRQQNPWLARVYLAHELCHILFDPSTPGRVQIALDDRGEGRARGPYALREARARGFAAELLLPKEGLIALFKGQDPPSNLIEARTRVELASQHFQTPGEITIHHLSNMGFLDHDLKMNLLGHGFGAVGSDSTTLPACGALPLCLNDLPQVHPLWQPLSPAQPIPAYVTTAQRAAEETLRRDLERVIDAAIAKAKSGSFQEATVQLVGYIEAQLMGSQADQARAVFDAIDVKTLPPQVATSLGTLSQHYGALVDPARRRYVTRLLEVLPSFEGYDAARVAKLAARMR